MRCDSVSSPIIGGSVTETYLGISAEQTAAVVALVSASSTGAGEQCTGVFIGPSWVITAAHCLDTSSLAVSDGTTVSQVVRSVAHPTADVALLQLERSQPDAASGAGSSMLPLRSANAGEMATAPATLVEIAGYGRTEDGASGTLHFVVEPITAVDSTTITVSGSGVNGACSGDSGGPLLVRAPDGEVVVGGVLSYGASTCRDDDHYARLDVLEPWIGSLVGSSGDAMPGPCGGITAEGRCLYGSAMWCDGTQIVGTPCGSPRACGWDENAGAFRCVSPAADPCRGVDPIGMCEGGAIVTCQAGVLETSDCGACAQCRIAGSTGAPFCDAPSAPAIAARR